MIPAILDRPMPGCTSSSSAHRFLVSCLVAGSIRNPVGLQVELGAGPTFTRDVASGDALSHSLPEEPGCRCTPQSATHTPSSPWHGRLSSRGPIPCGPRPVTRLGRFAELSNRRAGRTRPGGCPLENNRCSCGYQSCAGLNGHWRNVAVNHSVRRTGKYRSTPRQAHPPDAMP